MIIGEISGKTNATEMNASLQYSPQIPQIHANQSVIIGEIYGKTNATEMNASLQYSQQITQIHTNNSVIIGEICGNIKQKISTIFLS